MIGLLLGAPISPTSRSFLVATFGLDLELLGQFEIVACHLLDLSTESNDSFSLLR